MYRKFFNVVYMVRMIKDKLCDTMFNYYYNIHNKPVTRMNKSHSLIKDIYNLSYSINHIKDNIYLGNAYASSNYFILQENNIGLIVNVTEEIPNYYEDFEDGFNYIQLKIRDQNDENLFDNIDATLTKINEYVKENPNKNILIHCYMGSSRSASIACAYLIKYYNLTINESIELIKSKRDIVNINTTFIEDLNQFTRELNNSIEIEDMEDTEYTDDTDDTDDIEDKENIKNMENMENNLYF